MDYSSDIIQPLGFILVLVGITLILIRSVLAVTRGNNQRIRLGIEVLVSLSVIYWFTGSALSFVGQEASVESISNALAFLWMINLAFVVNTLLNKFLWVGLLSQHGERSIPKLITDGIGLLVYAVAIMFVLHYVYEEPFGAVLAASGAVAVVIGFGAQSTIREVFSGIALNLTKALRIGDYVEINGVYGMVYDIDWRSVSIKNPHTDSLYIFPNSAVAEQTILNFCEPTERFKYFVTFSVELSAPPALVIESIAKELENSRYVFRDPKPDFNLLGYSEHGIDFRVRFFFEDDDAWWDAQNEVIMAIWSAMRKQGLRISTNRMLQGSLDEWPVIDERVKARTSAEKIKSAVINHPILSILSEDEVDALCKSYKTIDLGPPSCFYKRGDNCDGLHLLLEGEISVLDPSDCGTEELQIDMYTPGSLFGIKSVVENRKHRYTAQATQYSIAVRFPQKNLNTLLVNHPKLLSDLSGLIAKQNADRTIARDCAMQVVLLAQHHKQRRALGETLRNEIGGLLQKPTIHHLFDHFSSSVRNEELSEGIMAGAAMIAATRGLPDDAEKEYLRSALKETSLTDHLDIEHCMELFAKYTEMLADGGPSAKAKVMKALIEAKHVKNGPDVTISICKGLCGVHAIPTKEEADAFDEISNALT